MVGSSLDYDCSCSSPHIYNIPVEIWCRILSWLTMNNKKMQTDLYAIHRTCLYLHRISKPFLYRDPQFEHILHWTAFVRTITRDESKGKLVKALSLSGQQLVSQSFQCQFLNIDSNGLVHSPQFSIASASHLNRFSQERQSLEPNQANAVSNENIQDQHRINSIAEIRMAMENQSFLLGQIPPLPHRLDQQYDRVPLPLTRLDDPPDQQSLVSLRAIIQLLAREAALLEPRNQSAMVDVNFWDQINRTPLPSLNLAMNRGDRRANAELFPTFWSLLQVYSLHEMPIQHHEWDFEQVARVAFQLEPQDLEQIVLWLQIHIRYCGRCREQQIKTGGIGMSQLPSSSLVDAIECMPSLNYLSLANVLLINDDYIIEMDEYRSRISVSIPPDFTCIPITPMDVLGSALQHHLSVLDLQGCKWVRREHVAFILQEGHDLIGLNLMTCPLLPTILNRIFFYDKTSEFRRELSRALSLC